MQGVILFKNFRNTIKPNDEYTHTQAHAHLNIQNHMCIYFVWKYLKLSYLFSSYSF